MKKCFVSIIVAALVGMAAMCIAIAYDASDSLAIVTYFVVAFCVACVLGVFDERKERKDESRSATIRRKYGHAAVFIGTACLYTGTPQQCDEMADDLWHYSQQAHVEMLTGEETNFEVL